MPLVAMEWNQPITSPNPGLEDGDPTVPADPRAETPLSARAPAAMPAEAYLTAPTLVEWPLVSEDSMHATFFWAPLDFRTSFA